MPEVIVVDEIGTEAEAHAARTIAERGVRLIATAHGSALENLIQNPTAGDLVGGIQSCPHSETKKHVGAATQKLCLNGKRLLPSIFLIEIHTRHRFAIHPDIARRLMGFYVAVRPIGNSDSP